MARLTQTSHYLGISDDGADLGFLVYLHSGAGEVDFLQDTTICIWMNSRRGQALHNVLYNLYHEPIIVIQIFQRLLHIIIHQNS